MKIWIVILKILISLNIEAVELNTCNESKLFIEPDNSGMKGYWSMELMSSQIYGTFSYDEEKKNLHLNSPDSLRRPTIFEKKMFIQNKVTILKCILEKYRSQNREKKINQIISSFYPIHNMCLAAKYYIDRRHPNGLIDKLKRRDQSVSEYRKSILEIQLEMHIYAEWSQVLEQDGIRLRGYSEDWLEKFDFISMNEFIKKYGRNGHVMQNLCDFSEEELAILTTHFNEFLLPYFSSSIGVLISTTVPNRKKK